MGQEICASTEDCVLTGERFFKASPTLRFKSSYTPPLINVITSTASKTLYTTPGRSQLNGSELSGSCFSPSELTIGTLDILRSTRLWMTSITGVSIDAVTIS